MVTKQQLNRKFNIIIGLLLAIFLVSGSFVAVYYTTSFRNQSDIKVLQNQIDRDQQSQTGSDTVTKEESDSKKIASYQALYQQNNDMVGWITIESTQIDFPVMQTKNVKDYYLYRNFNEEYSVSSLPYVQEQCDVFEPTDNVIIHGHNRSDGTMFATLLKYKKADFYNQHSIIEFDTINECHRYQVFAVFSIEVNTGDDQFPYYNFVQADDKQQFDQFVDDCYKYAINSTDLNISYGDKLLTLSTCDRSLSDGRCVVVAVRID